MSSRLRRSSANTAATPAAKASTPTSASSSMPLVYVLERRRLQTRDERAQRLERPAELGLQLGDRLPRPGPGLLVRVAQPALQAQLERYQAQLQAVAQLGDDAHAPGF